MNARHRLEKSSGMKYSDDNVSPEMKSLNKKFGIAHGIIFLHRVGVDYRTLQFVEFGVFGWCHCPDYLHCRYASLDS